MDDRTGELYPTREAAIEAGVPEHEIRQIRRIENGPFKGRAYYVNQDGSLGARVKRPLTPRQEPPPQAPTENHAVDSKEAVHAGDETRSDRT